MDVQLLIQLGTLTLASLFSRVQGLSPYSTARFRRPLSAISSLWSQQLHAMYLTVNALSVPVMGVAVRAQCIGAGQVPTVYLARAEESGKNGTKIFGASLSTALLRARGNIQL